MAQPYIAFDPGTGRVYGVGLTPAEAINDAEFQASVVVGWTPPWSRLDTRTCTIEQAKAVVDSNGPATLAQLERAA